MNLVIQPKCKTNPPAPTQGGQFFPPSTAMYKLLTIRNWIAYEPLGFETYQQAYKKLNKLVFIYDDMLDVQIFFKVFNPNGKLIKSIKLLNVDGQNIIWDDMACKIIRQRTQPHEKTPSDFYDQFPF